MSTTTSTVSTAHPFRFASGRWLLQAEGGRFLTPRLGEDPVAHSADLLAQVRAAEARTGRTHVICGLIPFDPGEAAHLRLTSRVGFLPRTRAGSRGPGGAGAGGPAGSGAGAVGAGAAPVPPPAPGPHDNAFTGAVGQALASIEAGSVEKVVLSRTARRPLAPGTQLSALAAAICDRLAVLNPEADVYCAPDASGQLWLGASPEVIADVRQRRLLTHPLAGSLPRTMDRARAEAELSTSDKDRREHAFVVAQLRSALGPLTSSLRVPEAPELFATDAMWHLGTRITGTVRPGVSVLDAALAVHPTPAVCGTPGPQAARLISQLEPEPRGFYAGLVGWMDASGDGRFSLVLRGARMDDAAVELRAGAGVVRGSDPEAEHRETEAKFRTMLAGLDGLV